METKPGVRREDTAAEESADNTGHMFEDRAHRNWLVHAFVIVSMVVVAVSAWPTEARKLERHAKDYLSAAFKGEPRKAYQYLAPESRERLRMDVWWAANQARLAGSEVEGAEVEAGGESAVVTLRDTRSKALRPTVWIKQGGTWYHKYEGR